MSNVLFMIGSDVGREIFEGPFFNLRERPDNSFYAGVGERGGDYE